MQINNKMSLYSLYLKTMKRQHIYSSIEDSEVVLVFERNNAGLKTYSVFSEQTSDSSAFVNAACFYKVVLNREQHFSYFDPDYRTVTGIATAHSIIPAVARKDLGKVQRTLVCDPPEIQTENFRNMSPGCYRCCNPRHHEGPRRYWRRLMRLPDMAYDSTS
jgi:hypothetical protein